MCREDNAREDSVPGGRCPGRKVYWEEKFPGGWCAGRMMHREDRVPGGKCLGGEVSVRKYFHYESLRQE